MLADFLFVQKSHKIILGKQNIKNNIADKHDKYIADIVSIMKKTNMKINAPYMAKGDILFGTQELCMDLLTLKMQISVDLQLQCTQ